MNTTSTRYFSFYDIDTSQADLYGDAFGFNTTFREELELLDGYGPDLPENRIIEELLLKINDL